MGESWERREDFNRKKKGQSDRKQQYERYGKL
jgi:hypothetical protein